MKFDSRVSIKPFLSGAPNGGYEKYNMVIADGAIQKESLGLVEKNNVKRYLTGLDELAPEVQSIKDIEKKEAVIVDIRKTIVLLENSIAGNYGVTEADIYETDDKGKTTGKLSTTFWGKVKQFISQAPDKFDGKGSRIPTYWDSVEVRCSNNPVYLDPHNPHDLILIYAIKAGGFTLVAPSLEKAMNAVQPPKFYLDSEEQTASIETELKKKRNKALAELQKMYDKDINKLRYVAKLCSMSPLTYRKSTSPDIIYNDCDKYINGESVEKNKKQTAERFNELANMTLAELRIQAIVKDATELNLLTHKTDGNLYYTKTGTPLGRTVSDVIIFLQNPLSTDILTEMSQEVEVEWNK